MKGKGYSAGKDGIKMKDGTEAWLTPSGNYYARREPTYEKWDTIAYYSLTKKRIPLAHGTCPKCHTFIQSKMCGDFVECKCGESFVDTDRWMPERHRYGGLVAVQRTLASNGGKARAKRLTAKQRSDSARHAVNARWKTTRVENRQ